MNNKPDLSFWKLWNISFGFFGVQIAYALQSAQVRLAVVLYNRLGAEGEESRTEGDVTRRFSALPEDLRREIFAYRTART